MLRRQRRTVAVLATVIVTVGVASSGVWAQSAEQISTVAGSGSGGFSGDGAPATGALLTAPSDVAMLANGAYLIADSANHRIRRVDPNGTITTVAGGGPCCGETSGFAGDGAPAVDPAVRLNQPRGVAAFPDGSFVIADTGNHRIRRVSAAGVISTIAGTGSGTGGGAGDGGPATAASLNAPGGVAVAAGGDVLVADTGNHRIRRITPNGTISRVAGELTTTMGGFSGDGGPATSAALNRPARVVPLVGGGFLIADTANHRIRRVSATGTIGTIAGSGTQPGYAGDGGAATSALLNEPDGVAVEPDGSVLVADSTNDRVRRVAPDGVIRTVAGSGVLGFAGDGGPPSAALLSHPRAVTGGAVGLLVADSFNHRIRAIRPAATSPTPPGAPPNRPPDRAPPGVSPAVVGRSAVGLPTSGTVKVRLPRGRRFLPMATVTNLPLGSEIDVEHGRVTLVFATTANGRPATAVVSGGRFVLRQAPKPEAGQRPGVLVLSGPLRNCPRSRPLTGRAGNRATGSGRASKTKRKRGRRLTVDAKGKIRTRGRYGAAIVRGTRWTIVDRCATEPRPGTLVSVARGRVAVTAFVLRRTRLVTAGRRYLAPARRAQR